MSVNADKHVNDEEKDNHYKDQFKRLTIDIPASLHRTIKSECALRGTKIADEIRELLMRKYESKDGK